MQAAQRLASPFGRDGCLSALISGAWRQGAGYAALQVMAHNEAALRLYRSMGISREPYGYHYRVAATP